MQAVLSESHFQLSCQSDDRRDGNSSFKMEEEDQERSEYLPADNRLVQASMILVISFILIGPEIKRVSFKFISHFKQFFMNFKACKVAGYHTKRERYNMKVSYCYSWLLQPLTHNKLEVKRTSKECWFRVERVFTFRWHVLRRVLGLGRGRSEQKELKRFHC